MMESSGHPTLLLVEDNPADAELVREMLDWPGAPTPYTVRHVSRLTWRTV